MRKLTMLGGTILSAGIFIVIVSYGISVTEARMTAAGTIPPTDINWLYAVWGGITVCLAGAALPFLQKIPSPPASTDHLDPSTDINS